MTDNTELKTGNWLLTISNRGAPSLPRFCFLRLGWEATISISESPALHAVLCPVHPLHAMSGFPTKDWKLQTGNWQPATGDSPPSQDNLLLQSWIKACWSQPMPRQNQFAAFALCALASSWPLATLAETPFIQQ